MFRQTPRTDPPTVTGINPSNGPTQGGNLLTITGSGMGPSVIVNLDTVSCAIGGTIPGTQYTQTSIVCQVPRGINTGHKVYVYAGGTGGQVNSFVPTYDYQRPVVTAVVQSGQSTQTAGPTVGGVGRLVQWPVELETTCCDREQIVQVRGSNFGQAGQTTVTIGGNICVKDAFPQTDSQYECTLPQGQGASQAVVVTVRRSTACQAYSHSTRPTDRRANQPCVHVQLHRAGDHADQADQRPCFGRCHSDHVHRQQLRPGHFAVAGVGHNALGQPQDRKSTRLNSSHT